MSLNYEVAVNSRIVCKTLSTAAENWIQISINYQLVTLEFLTKQNTVNAMVSTATEPPSAYSGHATDILFNL